MALLLTETELQSHEHPSVAFCGDALWMCAGTQKVWSNMWPCAGLLPKGTASLDLAGPILHGKHSRIKTPSLDPKAPLICCLYPKVWIRRRWAALRVSKGTLTPLSRGTQGTLPRGWDSAGPGLRLPAAQG